MTQAKVLNKRKNRIRSQNWTIYLGLALVLLLFSYLRFYPIVKVFYMGLFNWNMASGVHTFLGLENFSRMFSDKTFLAALWRTIYIGFAVLIITLPTALAISVAMNRHIRGKSFFQTCFFIPYIIPMVPVVIIWKWIFNTKYGLLNYILSWFGISNLPWLTNGPLAEWAIIIITVWKNLGYCILIFSVGLAGISKDYYEAADIDGASPWTVFRKITLPQLMPIIIYISVIMLIRGFNVYTQAYILASDSSGSPGFIVRVIVYDMMENGFRFFKMGYAASEAVVLFWIVFLLSMIQLFFGSEERRETWRLRRLERKRRRHLES